MKSRLKICAVALGLSGALMAPVFAQQTAGEVYGGWGGNLGYGLTLGYAKGIKPNLTLRGEFAGGLTASADGTEEGVTFNGKLKNNRFGAFADWFPGSTGGFRFTGGLTYNDTAIDLKSTVTGNATATVNGKTVNMNGRYYNVDVQFTKFTPYLGIGYGHRPDSAKGWGFFVDFGVVLGKFTATSSTDLVSSGLVTQADVDAQNKKVQDAVGGVSALPSFSIGARYNF